MDIRHIQAPRFNDQLPREPGVYWLIWSETPCETTVVKPRPISRLTGVDKWGILYIGCTKTSLKVRAGINLADRLKTLKRDDPWPALHMFKRTLTFDYLHSRHVASTIPLGNIALAWKVTSTFDAEKQEQRSYHNYRQHFGERPPFQRGFTMNEWEGLRAPLERCAPPLGPG